MPTYSELSFLDQVTSVNDVSAQAAGTGITINGGSGGSTVPIGGVIGGVAAGVALLVGVAAVAYKAGTSKAKEAAAAAAGKANPFDVSSKAASNKAIVVNVANPENLAAAALGGDTLEAVVNPMASARTLMAARGVPVAFQPTSTVANPLANATKV